MTPASAINHILDGVDGIEIDGGNEEVVSTLLAVGTSIIGIALQRLGPHEREPLLCGVEHRVRGYIAKVEALAFRNSVRKSANGHAPGNADPPGFLGANGAGVP